MEYRHKVMRGAVNAMINKAMRDIRSDPRRSIRNLADLGENFSTSAVQKHFFSIARDVLRDPDNPYNSLVADVVKNVQPETLRTLSLNFGYTALSYGAETIRRRQRELGIMLPWVLVFRAGGETEAPLSAARLAELVEEAVSLGIYTFVFETGCRPQRLADVGALCARFTEATFFAAVSVPVLHGVERGVKIPPNLVLLGDLTREEPQAEETFRALREMGAFYGFYCIYNEDNVQRLASEEFLREMHGYGCAVGAYVDRLRGASPLAAQVYRFVCEKRGKKGAPLFSFDFYHDTDYVGNAMACGGALVAEADGSVRGRNGTLARSPLAALLQAWPAAPAI